MAPGDTTVGRTPLRRKLIPLSRNHPGARRLVAAAQVHCQRLNRGRLDSQRYHLALGNLFFERPPDEQAGAARRYRNRVSGASGRIQGSWPPLKTCYMSLLSLEVKLCALGLRLHGFGIKFHALQSPTVRELLHSSDSMAWSFAGRKSGTEHNPRIALAYTAKIEALIGLSSFVQPQLFHWWNDTEHKVR